MGRALILASLFAVGVLAACSSDKKATPTTVAGTVVTSSSGEASAACVNAVATTGITAQTPVADATGALNRLLAGELPDGERRYYEALLAALDGADPAAQVGPLVADVPCAL